MVRCTSDLRPQLMLRNAGHDTGSHNCGRFSRVKTGENEDDGTHGVQVARHTKYVVKRKISGINAGNKGAEVRH